METVEGVFVPIEIVEEILLRLPARSIGRSRTVCKSWRSNTTAPRFIDAHLELARKSRPPSLLHVDDGSPAADRFNISVSSVLGGGDERDPSPVLSRSYPRTASIANSAPCNGLICISHSDGRIQLLNPTTGESLTVSEPARIYKSMFLGFHPITKEYKIVSSHYEDHDPHCKLEIYSLRTRSWKPIHSPHFTSMFYGATISGTMYWVASAATVNGRLVALDLQTETLTTVPLPPRSPQILRYSLPIPLPPRSPQILRYSFPTEAVDDHILELEGRPCVARRDIQSFRLHIWMLESADGRWISKYNLPVPWMGHIVLPVLIYGNKMLIVADGIDEDNDDESTLAYVNLSNGTLKQLCQPRPFTHFFSHVESLVDPRKL